MSREKRIIPHYREAVDRLNDLGGIDLYFFQHGEKGTEGLEHIPHIITGGQYVFPETAPLGERFKPESPLATKIMEVAQQNNSLVVPTAYKGEPHDKGRQQDAFDVHTLERFFKNAEETDIFDWEEYWRLQKVREMRSVMGSLGAFMAIQTDEVFLGRPVGIWGSQHSSSLPDMYDRVGVHSIDITDLTDCRNLIPPHARVWKESQLQTAFSQGHTAVEQFENVEKKDSDGQR